MNSSSVDQSNARDAKTSVEGSKHPNAGRPERELLAEADYFFDIDNWEATHNDVGTLLDEADLEWGDQGRILSVGRLKQMPTVYAVSLPVTFDDDGEPDDFEAKVFGTREEAAAAYAAAIAKATGEPSPADTAGSAAGTVSHREEPQ